MMQTKPKLKLTRPKEPAFITSQRVRSVKIKSSAELEEEMMAKIPKFKARPVNRKVYWLVYIIFYDHNFQKIKSVVLLNRYLKLQHYQQ